MKIIGKPFGYVLWGTFIGFCLGVALVNRSDAAGLDVVVLAIGGAILGYAVERFTVRRRSERSTQIAPNADRTLSESATRANKHDQVDSRARRALRAIFVLALAAMPVVTYFAVSRSPVVPLFVAVVSFYAI